MPNEEGSAWRIRWLRLARRPVKEPGYCSDAVSAAHLSGPAVGWVASKVLHP